MAKSARALPNPNPSHNNHNPKDNSKDNGNQNGTSTPKLVAPNPSSEGPRGNIGNHDNQGAKNAQQVLEAEAKYKLDELFQRYETISGVIRFLHGEGMETGAIAKYIGKRYQHVRNVLSQPLASIKGENTNATPTPTPNNNEHTEMNDVE